MAGGSVEKSFDQEIREEIIPSLPIDSEYTFRCYLQPVAAITKPVQQK